MKTVLAAIAFAALASSASAEPSVPSAFCKALGEFALHAASVRDDGIPLHEALRTFDKLDIAPRVKVVMRSSILAACKTPEASPSQMGEGVVLYCEQDLLPSWKR